MKPITKTIIIIASIVAALAIAILTLSLVKQTPLYSAVGGYESLTIYSAQSTDPLPQLKDEDGKDLNVDAALKNTGYSVMQGLLEGKPGAALLFKDDAAGTDVTTEAADVKNIQAPEGGYMIELVYGAQKTVVVEGEEIAFDRVRVVFTDSNSEIGDVELTFYLEDKIDNAEEDDYEVKTVLARAKTTALYSFVKDGVAAM